LFTDTLLTLLGFETLPVSDVTTLDLLSLKLLFVGLAFTIESLVLPYAGTQRAPTIAIIGLILYLPGFFADQLDPTSGRLEGRATFSIIAFRSLASYRPFLLAKP